MLLLAVLCGLGACESSPERVGVSEGAIAIELGCNAHDLRLFDQAGF
jgi:hypothetical protein